MLGISLGRSAQPPQIQFFAKHPYARMTVLTKSVDVENLLDLDHRGHTIVSWTTNPPEIDRQFEPNTPSVEKRMIAMKQCAAAGYPVRAVIMPIIPVDNWQNVYGQFLEQLLSTVPLSRITLGGTCIYKPASTNLLYNLSSLSLAKTTLFPATLNRQTKYMAMGERVMRHRSVLKSIAI